MRRVSRRDFRSRRSPLSLSVRQLHELRTALFDHRRSALRPCAYFDARLPDVRFMRGGVSRSGRPALPCRAERLSGLRAPARFVEPRGRAAGGKRRRARRGRRGAARRRDRRGQGRRRLSFDGRRAQRGGCATAEDAQAPRGKAVRGDVSLASGDRRGLRRQSWRGGVARRPAAADRPVAATGRRSGRLRRAAQSLHRRDAGEHAAPLPAVARTRSPDGGDERQPLRRADRHRRAAGAGASGGRRRPLPCP